MSKQQKAPSSNGRHGSAGKAARQREAPQGYRRGQRAEQRRQELVRILQSATEPITGMELVKRVGVCRQMLTQDMNVLRASGVDILATRWGYMMGDSAPVAHRDVLHVQHGPEAIADELCILVDLGIRVVNVMIDHPVYGHISAPLSIASRHDVQNLTEQFKQAGAAPLLRLTGGRHSHMVEAARPELFELARAQLRERGFLNV